MTQKFHLKCINNGEEFEMPNWTPKKHERALAKLQKAQKEKNATTDKRTRQKDILERFSLLLVDNSGAID